MAKNEFAEVFVVRNNNGIFFDGDFQNSRVLDSGFIFFKKNILHNLRAAVSRQTAVQNFRPPETSCRFRNERINEIHLQRFGGEINASQNLLARNARVLR